MGTADLIYSKVRILPEPTQQEVLNFVEYLLQKLKQEDIHWSELSLATALRGLEDEVWPEYSDADLKELAEKYLPYVEAWRIRLAEEPEPDTDLLEEARHIAEKCAHVLAERFGVRKVYLFGSVAGRGTFHKRSDIDLAVEGLSAQDYLKALGELWDLAPPHFSLDLVPLESARPELVELVLSEGILLHENQEVLHAAH